MKIVKLDKRYTLWHHGFRVALQFDSYIKHFRLIPELHAITGRRALGHFPGPENSRKSNKEALDRVYMMGFKDELEITKTLLSVKSVDRIPW